MQVISSRLLGEEMVIIGEQSELEAGKAEARKRNCALYTRKEALYLAEVTRKMPAEERRHELQVINEFKRQFDGWLTIPKDWVPETKGA